MSGTPKHVLVLGCGRSGTSIFGEFFDMLSEYQYYSEPHFDHLVRLDYSSPIALKVPRESENFSSTPGLSFPLDELLKLGMGNWQIFWIVRHPLDTISSLKVGIKQNWGHHPRPHDWREWLEKPLEERCAHHWNYINSRGYDSVRELAVTVKFEDMIEDPDGFSKVVCEKANIDMDKHRETIQKWTDRVQNTNNDKFVEAQTSREYSRNDHSVRVGRWKENLSKKDLKAILPIIRDSMLSFGYEQV